MKRPAARRRAKPAQRLEGEFCCSTRFEEEVAAAGYKVVAGLDEVGRGALCGPVVAGAVILGPGFDTEGIDDSKKLTRRQRERLDERIRAKALAWGLGVATVAEIDRYNILRATHVAMVRAIEALARRPEMILVDGPEVPKLTWPQRPIIKGDAQSVSIAAAAIVAKVARDAMMREIDGSYPGYGLAENMGYGSRDHREALRRMGPSEVHRRTFHGTQRWLF